MAKPYSYPDFSFTLDSGRRVHVHGFVWEPTSSEVITFGSGAKERKLKVERKKLQVKAVFGRHPTHFIGPHWVDKHVNSPPRIPNTEVTVWLSSKPISEDAIYSELIVVFYVDFKLKSSMEGMLDEALRDLNWEEHAEDITEAKNELWKEVWIERTVH
jgi:hypothetical protein